MAYTNGATKLRWGLVMGLVAGLFAGTVSVQAGAQAASEYGIPRGEDGRPLTAEELGTRQGLLTRLLKNGRQAVVEGQVYEVPAGLAVTDADGAVRSPGYLKPGMYVRYRYETRVRGGREQRVLSRVMVQRHEPQALEH